MQFSLIKSRKFKYVTGLIRTRGLTSKKLQWKRNDQRSEKRTRKHEPTWSRRKHRVSENNDGCFGTPWWIPEPRRFPAEQQS